MKKISIYCSHSLSNSEPNAIRLRNLAKIFKELGYDVVLYGIGKEAVSWEESGISNMQWKFSDKFFRDIVVHIKDTLFRDNPQLVISAVSAKGLNIHRLLKSHCEERKIPYVLSLCEWYNISNFGSGARLYRFFQNEFAMRFIYSKVSNIIAISSYIGNYYSRKGCNTIVIPTLDDPIEYSNLVQHDLNSKIRIVYAGAPRKKDCIVNAIRALTLLSIDERINFEFHVYGANANQIERAGLSSNEFNSLKDVLYLHGRIPYEEVKKKLIEADFTVLLRKNTRNANAGFSTKLGESMSCGTPVILNYTSDIEKYVYNGINGIVCNNESAYECAKAYRDILKLNKTQYLELRLNSKKTADDSFNYFTYIEPMKEFIEEAYHKV